MDEILKFLNNHPKIENINNTITRNEGFLKSLKEDRTVELEDTNEH